MSAFIVFNVSIKDPEIFQSYASNVGPTLEPFGGEIALRGKALEVLAGEHEPENVGIIKFPDRDSALGWYNSPAYRELIAERERAAEMIVICYEQPT